MIIRKEFRVESAHIVRNCTSKRCSHSIHGHSAVIEVFLESDTLDNAGMVYDFGLMKNTIKQAIDSMDHCYLLCKYDNQEFVSFIKNQCDRWIELPFNPSAENLSMFCFAMVQYILDHTNMQNGEHNVRVKSVRYHETTTGYAECDKSDVLKLFPKDWKDKVIFSTEVKNDWGTELYGIMENNDNIYNPSVKQQISIPKIDNKTEQSIPEIFLNIRKDFDELLKSYKKFN